MLAPRKRPIMPPTDTAKSNAITINMNHHISSREIRGVTELTDNIQIVSDGLATIALAGQRFEYNFCDAVFIDGRTLRNIAEDNNRENGIRHPRRKMKAKNVDFFSVFISFLSACVRGKLTCTFVRPIWFHVRCMMAHNCTPIHLCATAAWLWYVDKPNRYDPNRPFHRNCIEPFCRFLKFDEKITWTATLIRAHTHTQYRLLDLSQNNDRVFCNGKLVFG